MAIFPVNKARLKFERLVGREFEESRIGTLCNILTKKLMHLLMEINVVMLYKTFNEFVKISYVKMI